MCHSEMDGQRWTNEESKRYFAYAQYDSMVVVILRWTVKDGLTKNLKDTSLTFSMTVRCCHSEMDGQRRTNEES